MSLDKEERRALLNMQKDIHYNPHEKEIFNPSKSKMPNMGN